MRFRERLIRAVAHIDASSPLASSALKPHSQEWNFGESRTSGARIPRKEKQKRTASGTK
jgi:hypothetical protein